MASSKKDPKLEHLFMYFGYRPVSLSEMGDAKDAPLSEGLQTILDAGILGDDLVGQNWYDVIKIGAFKVKGSPDEEENGTIKESYEKFKEYEDFCLEQKVAGTFTEDHRNTLSEFYREWQMVVKLCND